jgi:hypothetical protein
MCEHINATLRGGQPGAVTPVKPTGAMFAFAGSPTTYTKSNTMPSSSALLCGV